MVHVPFCCQDLRLHSLVHGHTSMTLSAGRVHWPDSLVEGRVHPFRLCVRVQCQPTSKKGFTKISFVCRCSGSPVDVVQSRVMALAGAAMRLCKWLGCSKPDEHMGGQCSGYRLPEDVATMMETMTRGNWCSGCNSNTGWCNQTCIAMMIIYAWHQ